jgi:hypothetical protein
MKMFAFCHEPSSNFRRMVSSLRKVLLAAVLVALLHSNAPAGDSPPKPENCIEIEIERDTGNGASLPVFDEATLKKFREWRYKPKKVRRVKIPMMFQPIPPAVPSDPVLI